MRSKYAEGDKHPRTRQELAYSMDEDHAPYVRAKRGKKYLPTSWEDKPKSSCKKHRKKKEKRGKKHSIEVCDKEGGISFWRQKIHFQHYCEKHDIPYRTEELKETYYVDRRIYERVSLGYKMGVVGWIHTKTETGRKTLMPTYGMVEQFDWVATDRIVKEQRSYQIGLRLTWWSNKDIGIQHILREQ